MHRLGLKFKVLRLKLQVQSLRFKAEGLKLKVLSMRLQFKGRGRGQELEGVKLKVNRGFNAREGRSAVE